MPTQCPLRIDKKKNMKISERVLEIWPAQDLTTKGNNSRMSVRVVILVCNTPTQCPPIIGEVS